MSTFSMLLRIGATMVAVAICGGLANGAREDLYGSGKWLAYLAMCGLLVVMLAVIWGIK